MKELSGGLPPRQAQARPIDWPLFGWWGETAQVQKRLERCCPLSGGGQSGCDCKACLLQVAAYGGKLRYTLSYTAGAQGSSLSDPDIQIMVSTRVHAW